MNRLALLSILVAMVAASARGPAAATEAVALASQTLLDEWQVHGPFDVDPGLKKLGDPTGKLVASEPVLVGIAGKVTETSAFAFNPPLKAAPLTGRGVTYAVTHVKAPADATALLLLRGGADCSIAVNGVWKEQGRGGWDGRIVQHTDPYRFVALELLRGDNVIVVRLVSPSRLAARLYCAQQVRRDNDADSVYGAASFVPTAEKPVGFRGDGSGRYPGANPPLSWDQRTGQNIRWRVSMPGLSQSQPIVVKGRVFTLAEPNLLLCLDADTGKVLWQKPVDQLDADCFTPDQRVRGRALWTEVYGRHLEHSAAFAEYQWRSGQREKLPGTAMGRVFPCYYFNSGWEKLAESPEANQRLAELEELWRMRKWGGEGSQPYAGVPGTHFHHATLLYPAQGKEASPQFMEYYGKAMEMEKEFGFHLTSPLGMGWHGFTIATPCSDGQFVYVTMSWGQVACYDLDGNRQWLKWFRADKDFATRDPERIKYVTMHDQNQGMMSPLLAGDTLLTQVGYVFRAHDKRTGAVRWEYPLPRNSRYEWGQPRVFELGGQEVVFAPHGRLYRLSDGKILLDRGASDFSPQRIYADVDYQRLNNGILVQGTPAWETSRAFLSNVNGIAAYDLSLTGDSGNAKMAWAWALPFARYGWGGLASSKLPSGHAESTMRQSPLYDPRDGLLYLSCAMGELYVIDARTGKLACEWRRPYAHGDRDEGIGPVLAGNLVINHQGNLETILWETGRDPRPVGRGVLFSEWFNDALARQIPWAEYRKKWIDRGFILSSLKRNAGEVFPQGDSIYIRTDDALYRIGPKPAGDSRS